MAWNHKSRIVAIGIALQPTPGVFVQPGVNDLIAASVPTNSNDPVTTEDPTATGGIWSAPPIYLGQTGQAGATVPLRGPGGASPPALNAWPVGRILQAAGWTEILLAVATNAALAAGSTTTQLNLAAAESAVDDFLVGAPIQNVAGMGASAIGGTSLIADYIGSTKAALLAETMAAAGSGNYNIPAHLRYVLGTMSVEPPLLSISIWRDKKRYDYKDCRVSQLTFDIPVANDANQGYPSMEFQLRGDPLPAVDVVSTPALPSTILQVPVPPARGGKFAIDRVRLGHQSLRFTEGLDVAAASNQNAAKGQDQFETMSGTRSIDLDLNQMAVADFDLETRVANRTPMPIMSTWGLGAGNRFGMLIPNAVADPMNPGGRNGFVNLTGSAATTDVDKSVTLAIWW